MKLCEVIHATTKRSIIDIHAKKRRKSNPKKSKTTALTSNIDVFGGMVGYDDPGSETGSINPV